MSRLGKDPMLQELGASLKPCAICLQPKPCFCDAAPRTIGRLELIPRLKHVLQHEYDQGFLCLLAVLPFASIAGLVLGWMFGFGGAVIGVIAGLFLDYKRLQ